MTRVPVALTALAVAATAACTSGTRPAEPDGRIPYTASQTEQYFSAEQIAQLAGCGKRRQAAVPGAFDAATCELDGEQVEVATFRRASPERERYLTRLRSQSPHPTIEAGPYWVASSRTATASELKLFAPQEGR